MDENRAHGMEVLLAIPSPGSANMVGSKGLKNF